MNLKQLFEENPWRWCTFQGARDHVLLMGLETTFREKLEWLEEAEELSLRFAASREAKKKESKSQEDRNRS